MTKPQASFLWIPNHFTKAQQDLLLTLHERGDHDLAQKLVEAIQPPAVEVEKRGRPTQLTKEVLLYWVLSQGFEWNVLVKQAEPSIRRQMILEALRVQTKAGTLPDPIKTVYQPNIDPYTDNDRRKEVRDRIVALVQDYWGEPLIAHGCTVEETTRWLLGR